MIRLRPWLRALTALPILALASAASAQTPGQISEANAAPAWNPAPLKVYAGPDVVQPVATTDKEPALIVAEGEFFRVQDKKGWQVVHQDDSYASHTYGGMWVSQGGLLGAKADSAGAIATQAVTIPVAGKYRVWSK